jgi:site-specific DNA-adenine methylase
MRYLGSKNRIAKELVPIIQKYIDNNNIKNYYEPFVGGANIIDKINCKNRFGSDINEYLIELLNQVRDNVDVLPNTILESEYKAIKNNKENYPKWLVGFVGFCCSFGGKFFNGMARSKKNNGEWRNYAEESIRNLTKQSPNLKGIKFTCNSYEDMGMVKNSVIYCDIPYKNTTKYNNSIDYDKFYDWCDKMSKNENIVLISEYDMPQDRFECIWSKEHSTNFDCNRTTKRIRIEKLFIYKG